MATRTDNLKLSKAETSDAIKSTLIANNQNFDKLDGVITRLKNNQLQGTASGTEIEISDAGEVESVLHISGNSQQELHTGKNKFDINAPIAFIRGATVEVVNNSIKIINTDEDYPDPYAIYFIPNSEKLLGKTVTLSATMQPSGDNLPLIYFAQFTDITKDMYGLIDVGFLEQGQSSLTVTLPNEFGTQNGVKMAHFGLMIHEGQGGTSTLGDYVIYENIQLEEGSTATEYEPYSLSVSPDYPSEIRSVKGKSDNLFDMSKKTDNTSFTWAQGTDYETTGCIISDYIPIENIKSLSSNYWFNIAFYNSSKVYLGNGDDVTKVHHNAVDSMVMPNDSNISYFRVCYKGSASTPSNPVNMTTVTDIMLNKGTEALPYQPYGYVPVEVKVEGKNKAKEILVSDNISINNGVCTQKVADTNTAIVWKAQKRMEGKNVAQIRTWTDNSLGVKKVTFTKDDTFNRIYFGLNGSARDTLTYIEVDNLENGEIYTLQWNVLNATQGSVAWNNVQIEKGSTATPYEPYKGKTISLPLGDIELRSTPDTRDTFARVDGVWNKVEYNHILKFDGSDDEAWANQGGGADTENTAMFALGLSSVNADYANRISYCNRFKYYTNGSVQNSTDDVEGFNFNPSARYSNYIYFRIRKSLLSMETTSPWKTWLKSNPMEVVCPIKTPNYTPITDQALITALDELEQLILHEGYNYITAISVNGVKAYLDLSYYKDINIVLDNINASILSLGGGINV